MVLETKAWERPRVAAAAARAVHSDILKGQVRACMGAGARAGKARRPGWLQQALPPLPGCSSKRGVSSWRRLLAGHTPGTKTLAGKALATVRPEDGQPAAGWKKREVLAKNVTNWAGCSGRAGSQSQSPGCSCISPKAWAAAASAALGGRHLDALPSKGAKQHLHRGGGGRVWREHGHTKI